MTPERSALEEHTVSLRLLAVGIEFSAGMLLVVWGVASAVRPSLWRWRGACWWVDGAGRAVSRAQGSGVGLVGVAIAVSALAPLARPAGQSLELIGLVVMALGAVPLMFTHPAVREQPDPGTRDASQLDLTSTWDETVDRESAGSVEVPMPALAASLR